MAAAQSKRINLAVLDINPHGESSITIAEVLAKKRIDIIFVTGHRMTFLSERRQRVLRCEKPFDDRQLMSTLSHSRNQKANSTLIFIWWWA
jgi:DNA-binding NtrC family response regulator